MPLFVAPAGGRIREFNQCHAPKGDDAGGEFCHTDGGAGSSGPVKLHPVGNGWFEIRDAGRPEPIGLRTSEGVLTRFSKAEAKHVRAKWAAARAVGTATYSTSRTRPGEFRDMLSYVYGIVESAR